MLVEVGGGGGRQGQIGGGRGWRAKKDRKKATTIKGRKKR